MGVFVDDWSSVRISCTDIHGNADGDWVFPFADLLGKDGNICADPLFCDPDSGDFTLAGSSPCLPGAHPDCGLMGAHGVGCEAPSAVPRGQILTSGVQLDPGYPNPFNPLTTIRFRLASAGPTQVGVFDMRGRLLKTLVGQSLPAGDHTVSWNGRDGLGRPVSSGVYFVRLLTPGGEELNRKIMLAK